MSHAPHAAAPVSLKVLLLENVHASAHELLREAGCEVEGVTGALSEEELTARIKGVHVLGIRSKTQVTASVLAAADSLITLGCFCIGTNQVNLDAAEARGGTGFNAPFRHTRPVG